MKKTVFFAALLALSAFAETNSIDWRYGRPGVRVVTNAPSVALFTAEVGRVEARIDGIGSAAISHAALPHLSWTAGGHYGTPARLAGFFEGGMAGYSYLGAGLYFGGSDELSVSNEIIAGAALGATAIQPSAFTPLADSVNATNALFAAWFAGIFPQTNNWTTAYGWGDWAAPVASNAAAIAVLQTNTLTRADGLAYVTKEAFSTNRVTRWYDPEDPNRFGQLEGGTNIVIYKAVSNGVNITVSGSIGADGVYTPTGLGEGYLFIGPSPYVITLDTGRVYLRNSDTPMDLAGSDNLVAPYGPWDVGAETLPIVSSFSSFNLTTNVEWRYFLPTNAIPPELSNLDALQGWLNNLYAGKADFTNHTSTASIHVPIFIGTTNELPIIANRTNGVLYVEIP